MNNLSSYLAVRSQIRVGDVIVFSSHTGIGPLIELATASPVSHIGIVRQGSHDGGEVQLFESTIEHGRNGVQTNYLGARLAGYDGRAAWLPLSDEAHKAIDWFNFYKAIGDMEDRVKYNVPGLFKCLARMIPVIGQRVFQTEETDKLFCSGAVSEVFERSKLLRGINASKVFPQDLCEMNLYRTNVPILGGPMKIARFNTL